MISIEYDVAFVQIDREINRFNLLRVDDIGPLFVAKIPNHADMLWLRSFLDF